MNTIKWLQEYFEECCNDDWEHTYGIKIETLDNPGWLVDIALEDTNLEDFTFKTVRIERNENNWIICRIEDKVFKGRGGINNLEEILRTFQKWVESME